MVKVREILIMVAMTMIIIEIMIPISDTQLTFTCSS